MDAQDELKAEALYEALIDSWNRQDAKTFAGQFTANGSVVGFDGSQMNGPEEIQSELNKIFTQHQTAGYVTVIRDIRCLAPGVFVLRAVAGMLPPGQGQVNPAVNAIQSLVTQLQEDGALKIALFQNTPAAFHGRKALADALTQELQLEAERRLKENSL